MNLLLTRRNFGIVAFAGAISLRAPSLAQSDDRLPPNHELNLEEPFDEERWLQRREHSRALELTDLSSLFDNAKTIHANYLKLVPGLIQTTLPTIIWADTINISGKFRSNGQSIMMVARKVIVEVDTIFDTSGLGGQHDYRPQDRAADGRQAGQAGTNGNKGGDGKNGGALIIYANQISGPLKIITNGGKGGRGQHGGNGARGASRGKARNCRDGARGGNGGRAGSRGIGGNGGNAGEIIVHTVADKQTSIISTQLGGKAGAIGLDGGRGSGGAGGVGGKRTYTNERAGDR